MSETAVNTENTETPETVSTEKVFEVLAGFEGRLSRNEYEGILTQLGIPVPPRPRVRVTVEFNADRVPTTLREARRQIENEAYVSPDSVSFTAEQIN